MEAVQPIIKGLKCDASGCDYRDDTVEFGDYDRYLDASCPLCGANLLTEKDLATTKAIYATAEWLNALIGPVKDATEMTTLSVNMDGSGLPTFEKMP